MTGASAAGQHQTVAHVITTFAIMLPHLVPEDQSHALEVLERSLPAATHQVRTHELEQAIRRLRQALRGLDRSDVETSLDSLVATLLRPR